MKGDRKTLQRDIVKEVAGMDIRSKMKPAKTGLGRFFQNRKIGKFETAKMNTLKDISRRQQGILGKAVDAAKSVGTTLIASETARDMQNKDSYRTSLAAWTKNISGNPNPETGNDGETQTGSTSELGG